MQVDMESFLICSWCFTVRLVVNLGVLGGAFPTYVPLNSFPVKRCRVVPLRVQGRGNNVRLPLEQYSTLIMVVGPLQGRMMKWRTFCYSSMIQAAVQAEYRLFLFLFGWGCVGLCSEIHFLPGKIKCGPYPALTYIRLTANRKSSYGVRKEAVNFSQGWQRS